MLSQEFADDIHCDKAGCPQCQELSGILGNLGKRQEIYSLIDIVRKKAGILWVKSSPEYSSILCPLTVPFTKMSPAVNYITSLCFPSDS